jgi:hypothetical protein
MSLIQTTYPPEDQQLANTEWDQALDRGVKLLRYERYNKNRLQPLFIIHIYEHYMFRLLTVIFRCLTQHIKIPYM